MIFSQKPSPKFNPLGRNTKHWVWFPIFAASAIFMDGVQVRVFSRTIQYCKPRQTALMAAPIPGEELAQALSTIPIFDLHSRLNGARLAARGLQDLLREPALQAELQAASLEQARAALLPDSGEADDLVHWSLPRLSRCRNTLSSWSLRLLLRDLYNWEEPLTPGSWRRIDAIVRERARDPAWPGEVLKRAGIVRACTDLSGRGLGGADGLLQYSVEWGAFFHSAEHGFDAALYELERTWGRSPEPPVLHPPEQRPPTYRVVRSPGDIRAAAADYVRALPIAETVAVTLRLGNAVPGGTPSDAEMESALARRPTAGVDEGDVYSSKPWRPEPLISRCWSRFPEVRMNRTE